MNVPLTAFCKPSLNDTFLFLWTKLGLSGNFSHRPDSGLNFHYLENIPHKTFRPARCSAQGFLSLAITEHLKLSHFISLGTPARDQKALNIAKLKRHSFNPYPLEVWMKFGMGVFFLFARAVKLVLYIRALSFGELFATRYTGAQSYEITLLYAQAFPFRGAQQIPIRRRGETTSLRDKMRRASTVEIWTLLLVHSLFNRGR